MALVIPTGFAAVAAQIRNSGDPDPWYFTWGVDLADAGGDYQAVADACGTFAFEAFVQHMAPTSVLAGVSLRIGQDAADPLTLLFPFNAAGGSGAAKLPQNCAALIEKQTTRSGRTGKGRMFIPNYLNESAVSDVGVIDGSYRSERQAAISQAFDVLLDPDLAGPALPMVLLHNAGAPQGTAPTPITNLTLQTTISTQRKRLR